MYIVTINALDTVKGNMVELETLEHGSPESAKRRAIDWWAAESRYELTEVTGVRKL